MTYKEAQEKSEKYLRYNKEESEKISRQTGLKYRVLDVTSPEIPGNEGNELYDELSQEIRMYNEDYIALNLKSVNLIGSNCLARLVQISKVLIEDKDTKLRLLNVGRVVRDTIHTTGLEYYLSFDEE